MSFQAGGKGEYQNFTLSNEGYRHAQEAMDTSESGSKTTRHHGTDTDNFGQTFGNAGQAAMAGNPELYRGISDQAFAKTNPKEHFARVTNLATSIVSDTNRVSFQHGVSRGNSSWSGGASFGISKGIGFSGGATVGGSSEDSTSTDLQVANISQMLTHYTEASWKNGDTQQETMKYLADNVGAATNTRVKEYSEQTEKNFGSDRPVESVKEVATEIGTKLREGDDKLRNMLIDAHKD
jgi:hypothetical protein